MGPDNFHGSSQPRPSGRSHCIPPFWPPAGAPVSSGVAGRTVRPSLFVVFSMPGGGCMAVTEPNRFVIVGNGVAGTTAAEHLRKHKPDADVTLIAGEPYPLYNRVALPIFLKGRVQERNVMMRTPEAAEQRGVKLLLETWVTGVCPRDRVVHTGDGSEYPYDRLLIATGGTPRTLELPGADLDGVYQFQTLDDTKALIERCEASRS